MDAHDEWVANQEDQELLDHLEGHQDLKGQDVVLVGALAEDQVEGQ